jgi:hypothetical protein
MMSFQSEIRIPKSAIALLLLTFPLLLQAEPTPTATITPAPTPAVPPSFPAQATEVEGIVVPVPKEIFQVLDQFHDVNWQTVQRSEMARWKSRGDEIQIALLLGSEVAEGFIAMGADDAAQVKKVGTKVLALARALGVEKSVLRRSRSIIDYTDKEEWAAARKEWDGVLSDLEQGMIAMKSKPLLQLVSLGGWLRGTEALCALVLQDYSAEHVDLIRQPAMLDYLEKQLLDMPSKTRNHPTMMKMLQGLHNVRSAMEEDNGTLSKETVKSIKNTCSELVTLASHRPV